RSIRSQSSGHQVRTVIMSSSRCGVYCLALAMVVLVISAAPAQEDEPKDHYPIAWTQVDFKPIVDNDRLFKKYKECFIAEKPQGCPRDVTEFRKIIPEVIETLCAKCLPAHIERVKEAAEYICQKRRADYDEVRKLRDPTGEIQAKFEAKFGKVNC
ncbi:hypothetical protein ACR8ET_22490, partial [Salmonella enterica subsp. enterica serovar Paratyphi A]